MKKAYNPSGKPGFRYWFIRVTLLFLLVSLTASPLFAQFGQEPPSPLDTSSTDTHIVIKLTKQDSLEKEKEMAVIDSLIAIDKARLAKEAKKSEKELDSLRALVHEKMAVWDKEIKADKQKRRNSLFNLLIFVVVLVGYYFFRKNQ